MGRAVEAGPIFVFAYGAPFADCHECDMQGRGGG